MLFTKRQSGKSVAPESQSAGDYCYTLNDVSNIPQTEVPVSEKQEENVVPKEEGNLPGSSDQTNEHITQSSNIEQNVSKDNTEQNQYS